MASEELTAVFNAVETVSEALQDISRAIQVQQQQLSGLNRDYLENTATTEAFGASQSALESEIDAVGRSTSTTVAQMANYMALEQSVSAASIELSGALEILRQRLDGVEEEFEETNRDMALFNALTATSGISVGSLSVNVGAFTIALRDLGTQVPILVTTLGSLISVVGGVAASFTGGAAAISAFVGAGGVKFAQDLKDEFEGIEDNAQALEAIMGGLRDLFMEAFEPLMTDQNVELFVNVVEGLAEVANRFAQFANQVRPIVMSFIDRVEEGADSVDTLFSAIATSMAWLEDDMANLFIWFMNRIPDAIVFMSRTVEELGPSIARLTEQFIDMSTALIDMAGGVFPALVEVVNLLLGAIENLADIFNFLGDGLTQLIASLALAAFVSTKLLGIMTGLSTVIAGVRASSLLSAAAVGDLSGAFGILRGQVAELTKKHFHDLYGELLLLRREFRGLSYRIGQSIKWLTTLGGTVTEVNGAFAVAGTQGFIGSRTVATWKAATFQLGNLKTAIIEAAIAAKARAVAAISTLTTRLKFLGLAAMKAFATLSVNLAPSVGLVGSTSLFSASALGDFRMAIIGVRNASITATAATWLWNAALVVFNALTGGLPLILGAIATAGAVVVGVLGNMGKETSSVSGALGGLMGMLEAIGGFLLDIFIPIWNGIAATLEMIWKLIEFNIQLWGSFLGAIADIGIVEDSIGAVVGFFEWLGASIDKIISGTIALFNDFLGVLNMIPGVDVAPISEEPGGGLRVTKSDVKEGMDRDKDKEEEQTSTDPNVDLSFEDSVEQNVDVQADPEDKEGLRRTVKDAMEEANSIQRRRQGL